MRRISLVFIFLVALGTLEVTAEPLRKDREERVTRARIVRAIKSIFRVITTGDGLIPPWPTTPPQP